MNSSEQAASAAPGSVACYRTRGFEKKNRPDAFTACEKAVAHGPMNGLGRDGFGRDKAVELPVDEFLLVAEILRKVHASITWKVETARRQSYYRGG